MKSPVVFVVMQSGARANGGLQSISELMRRLKDHRAIVLTNLDTDLTEAWRAHGIEVRVVPEQASAGLRRGPLGTIRTYLRYHRALADILASGGARVVHANDPLAFQLSLTAAKLARARLALNLRDTIDPGRTPPRLKFRMLFAAADHVFYLSAEMAEQWRKVAANATQSYSITYSIVDPDRFRASRPPIGEASVVLIPGKFWPKKGQLEFIQNVVAGLAGKQVECWFAGDFDPAADPYSAACAAAAQPFGDHVRFLGYRDDPPELIAQASVVAIPSRHEGLVRGMIEAMRCGRPVVSFDVCSAREMLEHQSGAAGVVVRQGDYEGMAGALIHYATDRSAQAAAGQAGSALARTLFDPDQVVGRYERVYRELGRD